MEKLPRYLILLLCAFAIIMAQRDISRLPTARFGFANLHTLMSKFCDHVCGMSGLGTRRIPKTFLLCSMKCPGYHPGPETMTNATAPVMPMKEPIVEHNPVNITGINGTDLHRLRSQDGSTLIIVDSTYNQPGPL